MNLRNKFLSQNYSHIKRFPGWSSMEKLEIFSSEVRNGKAPEGFRSFVERCLKAETTSGKFIYLFIYLCITIYSNMQKF